MTDFENKKVSLPGKHEGVHKDFEAKTEAATPEEAKKLFETVKRRLLDINNWAKLCGPGSAAFMLTDAKGNQVEGPPQIGFYIKIDVPGPGSATGDGFDWVQVEVLEEGNNEQPDTNFIMMRVRPASNPGKNDSEVAHFFSDKATSNFLVMRKNNTVTAAVLGRNEIPNTKDNASLLDKLRNTVVGISAALGLSNPQWKNLVNGLLDKK